MINNSNYGVTYRITDNGKSHVERNPDKENGRRKG